MVLLSLALGIGTNTALFTAVNGLLLQTVSVAEQRRPSPSLERALDYGIDIERSPNGDR